MTPVTLPDVTVIEPGVGTNLPPGAGGQHVSRNYVWYRVNGGAWEPSVHRCCDRFLEWLACCETLADFLEGERQ